MSIFALPCFLIAIPLDAHALDDRRIPWLTAIHAAFDTGTSLHCVKPDGSDPIHVIISSFAMSSDLSSGGP
jgi:hypothetical protein